MYYPTRYRYSKSDYMIAVEGEKVLIPLEHFTLVIEKSMALMGKKFKRTLHVSQSGHNKV